MNIQVVTYELYTGSITLSVEILFLAHIIQTVSTTV